jgi:ubiquinone/menaquinone biosynthesis C-methylase UbiE
MTKQQPEICDYEGSDYQERFWDQSDRQYEDRVEAIALRRLLPSGGRRILEVGAGAGRNTLRYQGFEQIVLLDYARSQLELARERTGPSERYVFVVADAYKLPFAPGVFDAATMVRTLHHMSSPLDVLQQIRATLCSDSTFILEYANKRNLKAIARWFLRRQDWNPFEHQSIEFASLNYNFHPAAIRSWLREAEFEPQRELTVSHFRLGFFKRFVPVQLLVGLDSMLQWTGSLWQVTPSVFVRSKIVGEQAAYSESPLWRCPACGSMDLEPQVEHLHCKGCERKWSSRDGIYDFKEPI